MCVCVYKQWLCIFSRTNIILSTMDTSRIRAHILYIYIYTYRKKESGSIKVKKKINKYKNGNVN